MTRADPIDEGTLCRQRSPLPGPAGMDPVDEQEAKVSFAKLWAAYPGDKPYIDGKTGIPPKGFENQCAIKVSVALHGVGVDLRSFRGAHVLLKGKRAAIRAQEMATWLKAERIAGIARVRIRPRLLRPGQGEGDFVVGGPVRAALAGAMAFAAGCAGSAALWWFWTPRCNEACPRGVALAMMGFVVLLPLAWALAGVVATGKAAGARRWAILLVMASAFVIAWLTHAAKSA